MPERTSDPQVIPYLLYADAGAAMDWLIKTFAFTERVRDKLERHGWDIHALYTKPYEMAVRDHRSQATRSRPSAAPWAGSMSAG